MCQNTKATLFRQRAVVEKGFCTKEIVGIEIIKLVLVRTVPIIRASVTSIPQM